MLSDAMIGLIRTFVPTVIGTAIAWLTTQGVFLDTAVQEQLSAAFVGLCVALYYGVVTLLERKVNPAFGWLLGYAKAPVYPPKPGQPVDEAVVETPPSSDLDEPHVTYDPAVVQPPTTTTTERGEL